MGLHFTFVSLIDFIGATQGTILGLLNETFERIKTHITIQKSYRNPQLTVANLAAELNIQPRRLSHLINNKSNLNFNQFINKYRIEEAKQLLLDEKFTHLNMVGIAYEVGFNSKATFYTMFRQITGTTSTKFQKEKCNATL